jgi:hypothetical protein
VTSVVMHAAHADDDPIPAAVTLLTFGVGALGLDDFLVVLVGGMSKADLKLYLHN